MKILKLDRKLNIIILSLVFIISLAYSFVLANKRYVNYEYGKFDLGNMAQMVWNTSRGNFMEVTDQFGTNMPRWGMSHVDPILALFAPLYWIFPHPMLLVFVQHILILSAIYPLFVLTKWKTKSILASYLMVFIYILYPANGFTLVWTGFHGISFVAPLFIWLIWFLERNNFLIGASVKKYFIYWVLIVLMLMGKEEIGAILGLSAIFLYFKNKKLAIYTFIIGFAWTLLCFLWIIPAYSHYRSESVNTLLDKIEVNTSEVQGVTGENFFINRYSYLGNSYGEIIKNIILKPNLVFKEIFTENKLEALNHLFGPLGYLVVVSPFWLISLPDIAIVLLSQDEIFEISNHRIGFVTISLFVSLLYLLQFINFLIKRYWPSYRYTNVVSIILLAVVFGFTLYFSEKVHNPLYVSGKSFIENKVMSKVLAKEFTVGEQIKQKIPENTVKCLDDMTALINRYNPEIYSGPDYLGAQSSLRRVNALFPSRFWDADMIIADVYESKTLGVFGDTGWLFNKTAMLDMVSLDRYDHIYSCGKMSVFVKKDPDTVLAKDSVVKVNESEISQYEKLAANTSRILTDVRVIDLPEVISKGNPDPIVTAVAYDEGNMRDKMTYYRFISVDNPDYELSFVNYAAVGFPDSLSYIEMRDYVKETYYPKLGDLRPGKYNVFWGIGDLVTTTSTYIGQVEVTE